MHAAATGEAPSTSIRLARDRDVAAIQALIRVSARAVQAATYSAAQI